MVSKRVVLVVDLDENLLGSKDLGFVYSEF